MSAAVNEYQAGLEAEWTDPSNSSRSVLTSAEIANNNIRDKLIAIGEPIVSAESTVEILGVEQDGDRITVSARISTTFIYGGKQGDSSPGVVTDNHTIVLSSSGDETYSVIEDTVTNKNEDGSPGGVPDGYDPHKSSSEETSPSTSDGGTSAPTAALPMYNNTSPDVASMTDYAITWTSGQYRGDKAEHFNSDYPYSDKSNCTNFVSQVLHAGGWKYDDGFIPKNTANWAPDLSGPGGPSWTWVNAAYQYTYVRNGSYGYLDNIWNAKPGDLLYVDWEGDEKINHVMVVTGTTPEGDPSITQKSINRSNISLHHLIWLAEQEGMDADDFIWYGLQRQQQ